MSAKIKVVGIGGAGNNVVNRMVGVVNGVEFVAVNTDTQDLAESSADIKLAIGEKTTKGLGSGGDPSIGQRSAEESFEILKETGVAFAQRQPASGCLQPRCLDIGCSLSEPRLAMGASYGGSVWNL